MGKFLKILRYIANLIATMGANKSTLKQNISINSSDFRPEEPVWDEITPCSNSKLSSQYHSLFDTPLNVLKIVKNWMTGEYISWSNGQFLLDLRYNGTARSIKSVLFRKKMVTFAEMVTVAEIHFPSAWNFFKKDPILRIGEDEYPLPDYISVLRREITEGQFIQQLQHQYSCSDVEKILNVLTDPEVLYRSIY
jgi:hypothetical protein